MQEKEVSEIEEQTINVKEKDKSLDKDSKPEEVKEMTLEETFTDLSARRMGKFSITISYKDSTYLRNLLDNSEYKGPQQAYLLIISKLEMSQICEFLKNEDKEKRHGVEVTAATIESLSFFMNNRVGKGTDSAQKLFAASMQLRPAITEINEIAEKLDAVEKQLNLLHDKSNSNPDEPTTKNKEEK